jgi:hypothetical protein
VLCDLSDFQVFDERNIVVKGNNKRNPFAGDGFYSVFFAQVFRDHGLAMNFWVYVKPLESFGNNEKSLQLVLVERVFFLSAKTEHEINLLKNKMPQFFQKIGGVFVVAGEHVDFVKNNFNEVRDVTPHENDARVLDFVFLAAFVVQFSDVMFFREKTKIEEHFLELQILHSA